MYDHGVGIPDPVRLRNPRSPGLSLVRGLVEQLGGTSGTERAVGTRFVIQSNAEPESKA
ncbi:MAG: hypothetical protein KGS61_10220 [Verrucomicrobia bacterium]|nr:hypothetical protein [Verrucomicrobiota bacterium]